VFWILKIFILILDSDPDFTDPDLTNFKRVLFTKAGHDITERSTTSSYQIYTSDQKESMRRYRIVFLTKVVSLAAKKKASQYQFNSITLLEKRKDPDPYKIIMDTRTVS